MKIKLLCFLCFILVKVCTIHAQDRKLHKANQLFNEHEYQKAIHQYQILVDNGNSMPIVYQNLGDANYFNANYEEAAKWYEMLSNLSSDDFDVEHTYRYAQCLRSLKKYYASNLVMDRLSEMKKNDLRAKAYLRNKGYLKKIKDRSGKYTIENISINSAESDFAPSFRLDGLVFSTGRPTDGQPDVKHNWNKKRFLNLYVATISEEGFKNTMVFSDHINTKFHESSTAFTADGKTVYFTRNNVKRGKFSRDQDGVSRLKIYKASFMNGKWTNVQQLPFNSENYSVAHPALNKAEDRLYFSSDMPGSYGQSDIFYVDIKKDGSFGTPVNLGEKINTESKETFPFVTDKDILFFASNGHPGLGGLDIYATDLKDKEFGYVMNVGEPINSNADDFSLIFNSQTKKGYFASNRSNGQGDDDIYALTELKPLELICRSTVSGIVKDKETGTIVADAQVSLINKSKKEIAETVSGHDGTFSLSSDCSEEEYHLVANKADYDDGATTFKNDAENDVISIELFLSRDLKGAPIGTDLIKFLKMNPLRFEFNKYDLQVHAKEILDSIVAFLKKYPGAKVAVNSHTDSRGTDTYNLKLSKLRAKTTTEYMMAKGIDALRIIGKGFGESHLLNDCDDNTKCTDEKHEQNRRAEFILVE